MNAPTETQSQPIVREEVLADYRIAYESRQASLIGRRDRARTDTSLEELLTAEPLVLERRALPYTAGAVPATPGIPRTVSTTSG